MRLARWKRIARQFPENGIKLLLEQPANVHDLLMLTQSALLPLIDFDRLQLVRTTFVARDFRHVEADVVLTAPLRLRGAANRRTVVWLYILIEHQSEPDVLMPVRLLDYVVQIIKAQMRGWASKHPSFAGFRAQPILPVVLYTGTERWDTPGRLYDLVDFGERFRSLMPDFEPLFVNLSGLTPEQLIAQGGPFGQVLRLVRERKARPQEFRRLLAATIASLEAMPEAQRLRWLELLSYIHALVYHDRTGRERRGLQEIIEASVQTDTHRREVQAMERTIAQELQDEGRRQEAVQARQQTLLRLLRRRFGDVPKATAAAVKGCKDVKQLDTWLDNFATANALADLGINGLA
jgi:hypothetical protein